MLNSFVLLQRNGFPENRQTKNGKIYRATREYVALCTNLPVSDMTCSWAILTIDVALCTNLPVSDMTKLHRQRKTRTSGTLLV